MSQNDNRIAIIIQYFGKLPEWFDMFVYSCIRNTRIDWYFFTDCNIQEVAKNIFVNRISFFDYCQIISHTLSINFQPSNPYKLCDIRPFLGYIHQDMLSTYEFWGWGDVDVVWGDIFHFYSENLLDKNDMFSTWNDRCSGHLFIIRNLDKYRMSCFSIPNYKAKLCKEQNCVLDESDFTLVLRPELRYVQLCLKILLLILRWDRAYKVYGTISNLYNILTFSDVRKMQFQDMHTTPSISEDGLRLPFDSNDWLYKNGKVYNLTTGKETIYLHFQMYKTSSKIGYCWQGNYCQVALSDLDKPIKIDLQGIRVDYCETIHKNVCFPFLCNDYNSLFTTFI